MSAWWTTLQIGSAAAFLFFGVACITTDAMRVEFDRYGLASFRLLVGSLEVVGACGLLVGFIAPRIGTWSAAGLAALMICGLITRLRLADSLGAMMPALILLLVNAALCWRSWSPSS